MRQPGNIWSQVLEIIVDSPLIITAAHKLDPDDLEILSFLGEASLSCGDSTAARSYAESVLEKVHILSSPRAESARAVIQPAR